MSDERDSLGAELDRSIRGHLFQCRRENIFVVQISELVRDDRTIEHGAKRITFMQLFQRRLDAITQVCQDQTVQSNHAFGRNGDFQQVAAIRQRSPDVFDHFNASGA